MQLPIIIVHRGKQKYLHQVISCAISSKNNVILIGNKSNKSFSGWVDEDLYKSPLFSQFEQVYKHYSSNTPEFELVCFERYFVTYEYMKKNNISACIMMDSDVVLYKPVHDSLFAQYDLVCGIPAQDEFDWIAAPNFAYWTIDVLKQFLDYCVDMYQNHLDKLEEKWYWHKNNNIPGGLCDMSLLYLFIKSHPLKFYNSELYVDSFIDTKIGLSAQGNLEFIMNDKFVTKKILYQNDIIFFKTTTETLIPVMCIHAQGKYKKHIRSLTRKHFSDISFHMDTILWNINLFFKKVYKNLSLL